MKNTGTAPCLRTVSLCFLLNSENTDLSCGWIGHWLQSIMMARSNNRSSLLKSVYEFPPCFHSRSSASHLKSGERALPFLQISLKDLRAGILASLCATSRSQAARFGNSKLISSRFGFAAADLLFRRIDGLARMPYRMRVKVVSTITHLQAPPRMEKSSGCLPITDY